MFLESAVGEMSFVQGQSHQQGHLYGGFMIFCPQLKLKKTWLFNKNYTGG
jgi:hypothetical protein